MVNVHYKTAWCTDVGTRKKCNEDSALILQANTSQGPVLLAAICDGMGGLSKGELASATVICAFKDWFIQKLPNVLNSSHFEAQLSSEWNALIQQLNNRISVYGLSAHIQMGTTVTVLLLVGMRYYILNVGDSRVYLLGETLCQLTHDQTVVQQEIDEGILTEEQAEHDARRSILLQCVGAPQTVIPDFFTGELVKEQRFLLCCDGFRHMISPQEIFENLCKAHSPDQEMMEQALNKLVQLNKERQETDNITALVIEI